MSSAKLIVQVLLVFTLFSCNTSQPEVVNELGSESRADASLGNIIGAWFLYQVERDGVVVELSECDRQTRWHFTNEETEALGDGTEVRMFMATTPEGCEHLQYQAKWTAKEDGQIFISSVRIGAGGISNAGLFEVARNSGNSLVLKNINTLYYLKR